MEPVPERVGRTDRDPEAVIEDDREDVREAVFVAVPEFVFDDVAVVEIDVVVETEVV